MLNYIKKIVSPELNVETYEIGLMGAAFQFEVGTGLSNFLDYIKGSIRKEMMANKSRIAKIEIESRQAKESKFLNAPIISQYETENKKLNDEIVLIEALEKHLDKTSKDDIFSEERYLEPAGITERLKLKLGFKPSTIKGLEVYRGILERKIGKLEKKKQKSVDRRNYAFEFDVASASPDIVKEEVDDIYDSHLEELYRERDELIGDFAEKDSKYTEECDKIDARVAQAFESVLPFSRTPNNKQKDTMLRDALREYFADEIFRKSSDDYTATAGALRSIKREIIDYKIEEKKVKKMIIHEILEYNKALKYERTLDSKIEDLHKKGMSYIRKYK